MRVVLEQLQKNAGAEKVRGDTTKTHPHMYKVIVYNLAREPNKI